MVERIVPDTSVIIEGILSRKLELKEIGFKTVIIHEAVMAELESQANKNRETGFLGLEEIKRLRELSVSGSFSVEFKGSRPTEFEIKHAKSGEIDSLIRNLAAETDSILVTADKVQALVAQSKGIEVLLFEFEEIQRPFILEKYFDSTTMSVHVKEDCVVMAKRGMPGLWKYVAVGDEILEREAVKDIAKQIVEQAAARTDAFIESDRKGSTIVQLANNRIVITRPPFSDGYEITVVRPIRRLALRDYLLDAKTSMRIEKSAEGILIAGAPGQGKSTFAQALAEHYLSKSKVIKTIESPRDLSLPAEVTQYSMTHGLSQEIHDILLLSRPDYTIFDEMRNTEDFRLFSDLRLSGVGMVGVIHATNPIDAIQRFIGRIELGVIPHVVDTVIFIKDGAICNVYNISMEVKLPSGMIEADLARPVVCVHDFVSGKLEFEIYTYGEQTVVMPVSLERRTPAQKLAEHMVEREISRLSADVSVEMLSDHACRVIVPIGSKADVIGRQGAIISELQDRLGLHIGVVEQQRPAASSRDSRVAMAYAVTIDKKNVLLDLGVANSLKNIDILHEDELLISAIASKKGVVSISKSNRMGKIIVQALQKGEKIEVRG